MCRNKVKVKTCFAGGMSPGDITSPLAAILREACAPPTGDEFPLRKCWFYIVPFLRTPQGDLLNYVNILTYFASNFNRKLRRFELKYKDKDAKKVSFGKKIVFSKPKK